MDGKSWFSGVTSRLPHNCCGFWREMSFESTCRLGGPVKQFAINSYMLKPKTCAKPSKPYSVVGVANTLLLVPIHI